MDESSSRSQLVSLTTVMFLAAAVGGWLFFPSTMRSFRPEVADDVLVLSTAAEDVPARLWQDPFSAVVDYRDELGAFAGPTATERGSDGTFEAKHAIRQLQAGIATRVGYGDPITIMPVMVLGGQHAESIEERRRQRYAVVAGLGRREFVPENDSQIGFIETHWKPTENGDLKLITNPAESLTVAQRDGDIGTPSVESSSQQGPTFTLDIPFEWYEPTEKHEAATTEPAEGGIAGVLVMWIDEIQFLAHPHGMMVQLLEQLVATTNDGGRVAFRVIGPSTSTGLRSLLRDIDPDQKKADHAAIASRMRYYSTRATRWPMLFQTDELETFEAIRASRSRIWDDRSADVASNEPILVVAVSDDYAVLGAIVDELELRPTGLIRAQGAERGHVAMVGEWDTHYGRALTRTFRVALCATHPGNTPELCRSMPTDELFQATDNVHEFHYLRGIDGLVPGASKTHGDSVPPPGDSGALDLRTLEQPEGSSQLDYVRRLADRIANLDRTLKNEDRGRIRAVGVVGSDLYDKQLILQALRPHFPHALFFTTDLDARLFHPSQYHWSRNLIIGSSFGLSLRRELQGSIPPFRNTYQTSTFLGAQLALGPIREEIDGEFTLALSDDTVDLYISAPRIYEVARSGAYDLSWSPSAESSVLHPDRSESRRRILSDRWPVLLFVVAFLALVPFSATARRWLFFPFREQQEERPIFGIQVFVLLFLGLILSPRLLGPVALAMALAMFIPAVRKSLFTPLPLVTSGHWSLISIQAIFVMLFATLLVFIHLDAREPAGEPFELLQGISVWPTEILRLFAVMMCVYFMINAAHDLRMSCRDIEGRYGLPAGETVDDRDVGHKIGSLSHPIKALNRLFEWLGWRVVSMVRDDFRTRHRFQSTMVTRQCAPSTEGDGPDTGSADLLGRGDGEAIVDAAELWKDYRRYGSPWRRAARVIGWFFAYAVFLVIVFRAFDRPLLPVRGELSPWIDARMIAASSVALTLVALFVLDANNLAAKLIGCFEQKGTRWPPVAREKAEKQRGIKHREAAEWLEINLIAEHTAVVGRFVIHPFFVLTILLVARNSFFDLWTWPLSLVIVFGVLSGFIIASGLILRRAAESARNRSLRNLSNLLARLEASVDEGERRRISQVKMTIDDIKSIRTGAFSPWSENPVVRAVLLPFGGTGIVILFDLLSKLGL